MERFDYGTNYKYYPNSHLALGRHRHPGQQLVKGKQEFSLVALNPHRDVVGLSIQDFTPSKLCTNILTEAEAAEAPAAAPAEQQDSEEHQLLDARTPVVPAPDEDALAAEDAVEDDAIPTLGEPKAQAPQQQAAGPEIQFIIDSEEESQQSETESESRSEQQDQQQLTDLQAHAAADSRPAKRRKRDAAEQAASGRDDSRIVFVASSSSSSSDDEGSSTSSGESGSESKQHDDEQHEQHEQQLQQSDAEAAHSFKSEEDEGFIPLLPLLNKAADAAAETAADKTAGAKAGGRTPGFKPPWLPRLSRFGSPLLRLHNEVVAFTKMLEPTPEEVESRSRSMRTVREVVHSIWPQANVLVFGSYETGLYTPASDTDIVVCDAGLNDPVKGLKALAHALTQRQLVRNLQQVLTARVPIIKFEMVDSGLAFDVAWEQRSGPEGAKVVKQLLAAWPVMKPMVLVLKVFLTQRELNEVYQGGIGSYSLIIMVAAFLQMHASRRPSSNAAAAGGGRKRGRSIGGGEVANALEANLGLLLIDFMRLFGRALNVTDVGISCSNEGFFYSKSSKGFFNPDRPFLLSVQDPLDPTNDTARNSWNWKTVRQVFDHAYQLLTAPCAPGDSLLGRIIHLQPVVSGRPIPAWFNEVPSNNANNSNRRRSQSRDHRRNSRGSSGMTDRGRSRGRSVDHRDRQRPGSGGGSSKSRSQSERQQGRSRHQQTPGSSQKGIKKQQQGSSSYLGGGRDAAGRAGAAGGSQYYNQQQQYKQHHSSSKSPGPGRKKQRR